MEDLELYVAYGAIKHFGKHLYTSNPPAIAELIANSFDAYATKCEITFEFIEEENKWSFWLLDNGIGMTENELRNRYATAGIRKDSIIRKPQGMDTRRYMGRKGIGKLACFSLGNEYTLTTKADSEKHGFQMKFVESELEVPLPKVKVKIDKIAADDNKIKYFDQGFQTFSCIYIPSITRSVTRATIEGLKDKLARRFFGIKNFEISIRVVNKSEVKNDILNLQNHYYYDKVEFMLPIGGFDSEHFAGIKQKIPLEDSDYIKNNKITGWIGSVEKPSNLIITDESVSGVTVYINGKLCEENLLKRKQNVVSANSYIVGEINADYLQTDEIDPVLSSREGLDFELKSVKDLEEHMNGLRNYFIKNWSVLRVEQKGNYEYSHRIKDFDKLNTIYSSLTVTKQKEIDNIIQSVLDKPTYKKSNSDEFIISAAIQIVNNNEITKLSEITTEEVSILAENLESVFESSGINYALRIQNNISERIEILKIVRTLQRDEEKEAIFEKVLLENAWLLNPYWDQSSVQITTQVMLNKKYASGVNKKTGYIDLLICVSEKEFPIIVEIKREKNTAYSTPNVELIIKQLTEYRRKYSREQKLSVEESNKIELIFICGKAAKNKLDVYDFDDLKKAKINLFTYDELIENALKLYCDFLSEDERII